MVHVSYIVNIVCLHGLSKRVLFVYESKGTKCASPKRDSSLGVCVVSPANHSQTVIDGSVISLILMDYVYWERTLGVLELQL